MKTGTRLIAGGLAFCLSLTAALGGRSMIPAHAQEASGTETEWETISGILDSNVGVYTADTKLGSPWDTEYSPDGPLMGNGTVYAFVAGDQRTQNFYISHSNMWHDRASKDGQEYTTFGGITIQTAAGAGSADDAQPFRYEQDMKNAEITAQSTKGFTTVSYLSARENILVTEITNVTQSVLPMEVTAWTANANTSAKTEGNTMIATKKGISEASSRESGTGTWEGWNVNVAMASRITGDVAVTTENVSNSENKSTFSLQPGQTVTLVSAVEGGKEEGNQNSPEQAIAKATQKLSDRLTQEALEQSKGNHRAYWKDYWMKSYIDIQDDDVERMYYGMLYQLGCSTSVSSENNGGIAAGLFPWTATEHPAWQGDYTTNTDFQRQVHPLVNANRTSGIANYLNIVEQYWPEAQRRAGSAQHLNWVIQGTGRPSQFTEGIQGGALLPTHIGPWGASTEQHDSDWDYFQSPADATSVLMPLIKMWKYTLDEELLERLYPMMKSVATFWENYVTYENGKYVVYGATHEGVPGRNPILDVDACKYMLRNTILAAQELKVDADKMPVWQNILDNMSSVPTFTYNGKETICDVEGRTQSNPGYTFNGNPVTIQSVYYFDSIGMTASDEEKEKYVNYLAVKNGMGTHRRLISATRLGYDIYEIIDQLKAGSIQKTPGDWEGIRGNNTIGDIGGTGRLAIVQDSLLQSNEGFINIFANWYDDQRASFRRLRAENAFLVDADKNELGQVTYVKIHSEKGRDCSVLNPWPEDELEVYENGQQIEIKEQRECSLGTVYTFATSPGAKYELKSKNKLPDILTLDKNSAELKAGFTEKLNVTTNVEDARIVWTSSNPEAAVIGNDGTILGLSEGTAMITAAVPDKQLSAACEVTVRKNEPENVAPEGTAASDSYHDHFTPDRAINGAWDTQYEGWVSANKNWDTENERWLEIDLGREFTIDRWVLRHGGHRGGQDDNRGDYYLQVWSENSRAVEAVDFSMDSTDTSTEEVDVVDEIVSEPENQEASTEEVNAVDEIVSESENSDTEPEDSSIENVISSDTDDFDTGAWASIAEDGIIENGIALATDSFDAGMNSSGSWVTVDSKTDNYDNTTDRVLTTPVTGRYFRIYMEFPMFQSSTGWPWPSGFARLNQVELYGIFETETPDIINIQEQGDVSVPWGTAFEDIPLPETATAELSNGMNVDFPVIWERGAYAESQPGEYSLSGTLQIPGGIDNTGDFNTAITVSVQEKEEDNNNDGDSSGGDDNTGGDDNNDGDSSGGDDNTGGDDNNDGDSSGGDDNTGGDSNNGGDSSGGDDNTGGDDNNDGDSTGGNQNTGNNNNNTNGNPSDGNQNTGNGNNNSNANGNRKPNSPKTGDAFNTAESWAVMTAALCGCFLFMIPAIKRRKKGEKHE